MDGNQIFTTATQRWKGNSFQKMILEQVDSYSGGKKSNLDSYFTSYKKVLQIIEWNIDLTVK